MQLGNQLRRALALVAAGAGLTAIAATAPTATAARSKCRGGTAQAFRDGTVRVYRQGSARTYACLFATGRRSRLSNNAQGFRRAGRYLAYFALNPSDVSTTTESRNLATGKLAWAATLDLEEGAPPAVRRLSMRASDGKYGAVVGSGADTQVIRVRGQGGYDQLDSGAGIVAGSLSATPSLLRWRSGGAPRSAGLGRRDTTPGRNRCPLQGPSDFVLSGEPVYSDGEVAVIYLRSQDENPAWEFCRFRTGRKFALPFQPYEFRRAGDYLLFQSPDGCSISPPQPFKLESRSIVDGRVVAQDAPDGPPGACPKTQTVLRGGDGAFAYIVDPLRGQPLRVVAVRRTGSQVLDPGPGVEFGSLSLSGSTLSWRNGGAQRTATL